MTPEQKLADNGRDENTGACESCRKPWGLCECWPRPAGKQAWIDKHMGVARELAVNAATRSGASQRAFEDCLRLRELAGRQTLRVQDNRDLDAIADRLHALAVSRIDTRYDDPDLRERCRARMVGLAEIARRLRETGDPDELAEAAFIAGAIDEVAEYVGLLRGVE